MSVTVEKRVVPPGSDQHVELAWRLKEHIRESEGLLKQEWGFFSSAYRRSTVYVYITGDDTLVGFAAVRRDGYVLFLAVAPEYRGEGYGERLVATAAENYTTVTCHARATNENALGFYEHLGFERVRRIDNYYEDGGASYYLRLGDHESLRERLSEILGR